MQQDNFYDVIIIGAGPCGLACAIEAKKAGLSYVVLEKGTIAEAIRQYPQEMTFFSTADNISIGGLPFAINAPKATRNEALQYYRKVVEYYDLNIQKFTEVIDINREGEHDFYVYCRKDKIFRAAHVIFSIGYFTHPRQFGIPGENMPHVSHYYKEAFECVHAKVVIAGGGNSAVSAALDLYHHNADVTLILRGKDFKPTAKYWLLPDLRNRIKEGKIKVRFSTQITQISRNNVTLRHNNQLQQMPADFVFLLVGYMPNIALLEAAGVHTTEEGIPFYNPKTFETNVPQVYTIGTTICGIHTENVFIENGRHHGEVAIRNILNYKFLSNLSSSK